MIEGGGLGVFTPEEIGPVDVQTPNGVIDILVEDEAEATRDRKAAILSYFQGAVDDMGGRRPAPAAPCIPENRLRVYDMREIDRRARRRRLGAGNAAAISASA